MPESTNGCPVLGLTFSRAIKAEFPEARLVAEDLGIITDSVRALVEAVGVPGMKVLQFGFEGATEYLPHSGIPNSVLYPGTHDNDTSWGWFNKQSEPVKDFFRRYLRVPGDAVPWDMIRAGYAVSSRLFIVPMQDLLSLGSEARMNTPVRRLETGSGDLPENRWTVSGRKRRILERTCEALRALRKSGAGEGIGGSA